MTRSLLLALSLLTAAPFALADPSFYGTPDAACAPHGRLHDYVGSFGPTLEVDGCATGDGHPEWAVGGARLLSSTGDGVSSGSLACHGGIGHHPAGGTVTVLDSLSASVVFVVAADHSSPLNPPLPGEPDCGDGILEPCNPRPPEHSPHPQPVGGVFDTVNALLYSLFHNQGTTCNPSDIAIACVDSCAASFPPGADGSYVVSVIAALGEGGALVSAGTAGHVHL